MMTGMSLPAGADMAPDFMLTINAKDITQNIRDRLLSLSLTDNRGFEADQLDVELDDEKIFSKWDQNRFPDNKEILQVIEARLK